MTTSAIAPSPGADTGPASVAAAASQTLSVAIGRLAPLDGGEDELMILAAAAAPVGSQDPADRAIVQTAAAMHDLRHFSLVDGEAATPQSKLGAATIRDVGGATYRILRGEVNAVLKGMQADDVVVGRARAAAGRIVRSRQRPLAVAVAPVGADGEAGAWRLVGLIPLRATLVKTRIADAPVDWVYVKLWDPALRYMHWIAVCCIVTLIGTGYMIATPFLAPGTGAPQPYLMGYIRLAHFIAAGILIATAVVRIADLFFSPYPYARWRSLWPIYDRTEAKATADVLKGYLFLRTHRNPTWIGLNPLQAITYTGVYALAILMVVTGMALFGLYNQSQWPYSWFQWLNTWFGADTVRTVHYIGMWLFLIFIPAHIYLSARSDTIDRGGAISSMFNGGVWVRKDAPVVDAEHYRDDKD
ncbi:MAG: Ni/Fe-hydrogenase, b-type cytochrome subunit [Caldilineaceae bacterium]